MRKLMCLSIVFCTGILVQAQVLNTGQTLRAGKFSFTAAPLAYVVGEDMDPGLYGMIGIGLPANLDLCFNARIAEDDDLMQFGADLEWAISNRFPAFSLTWGMHGYRDFGIDLTANLSFPGRVVTGYGGVDSQFEFTDDDIEIPVWGFGGAEIMIRKYFGLLFELSIGITDPAPHIVAFGVVLFI